jgi:hypothetical protein
MNERLLVGRLATQSELGKPGGKLLSLTVRHRATPLDRAVAVRAYLTVVDLEGCPVSALHVREWRFPYEGHELLAKGGLTQLAPPSVMARTTPLIGLSANVDNPSVVSLY